MQGLSVLSIIILNDFSLGMSPSKQRICREMAGIGKIFWRLFFGSLSHNCKKEVIEKDEREQIVVEVMIQSKMKRERRERKRKRKKNEKKRNMKRKMKEKLKKEKEKLKKEKEKLKKERIENTFKALDVDHVCQILLAKIC